VAFGCLAFLALVYFFFGASIKRAILSAHKGAKIVAKVATSSSSSTTEERGATKTAARVKPRHMPLTRAAAVSPAPIGVVDEEKKELDLWP